MQSDPYGNGKREPTGGKFTAKPHRRGDCLWRWQPSAGLGGDVGIGVRGHRPARRGGGRPALPGLAEECLELFCQENFHLLVFQPGEGAVFRRIAWDQVLSCGKVQGGGDSAPRFEGIRK